MNSNIYNYYCDESCHLQNDDKRFMVLGYISAPYHKIKKLKDEIKELRLKHNNSLEIKWTNLNNWNYKFYSDLVDLFFERTDLNFRAIIVDKHRYMASKCDNDYDKFYYLMYYQLIYHLLDVRNKYNIYLDIKDDLSSYRIREMQDILNVRMGTIDKIQHVRSHEIDLLQLCDLFIGAISYNLNIPKESRTAIYKLKLIDKIKMLSKTDLENSTGRGYVKYNLFKINI